MINGLTRSALIGYFRRMHESERPLYLHRTALNAYELFPEKRNHEREGQTYAPMTYRQVVLLASAYKTDISQDREQLQIVINELSRMRAQKKRQSDKVWYIVSLVYSLWDQCLNWRQGYEWKSTAALESELATFLTTKLSRARATAPAEPASEAHDDGVDDLAPPPEIQEEIEKEIPAQPAIPAPPVEKELDIVEQTQEAGEPATKPLETAAIDAQDDGVDGQTPPPWIQEEVESDHPALHAISAPPDETELDMVEQTQGAGEPAIITSTPSTPILEPHVIMTELPRTSPPIKPASSTDVIPKQQKAAPPRPFLRRATDADLYRENPKGCRPMSKTSLFMAVEVIKPHPRFPTQRSFVNLLEELSGNKEPALEGVCAQAVKDMFERGSKEAQDQLSLWLKTQPTMNQTLFIECLETLNAKHQDQKPVSALAITELIKNYREKGWDQDLLSHEAFNASMCVLLEIAPNDDNVCKLVRWICGTPQFTRPMHDSWIEVLDNKEKMHGTTLLNPARVIMEEIHPEWLTARIIHQQSQPVLYKAKSMAEIAGNPNDHPLNNISAARRSNSKKEALDAYKNSLSADGVPCTPKDTTMVFREIKFVKAHPNPIENREITSLEDLLMFVAEGLEVDFEDPICQRALLDVINNCGNKVGDAAVEWACGHATFSLGLLVSCLEHYSRQYRSVPTNKLYGLERLLSTYCEKKWAENGDLPPNDPALVEAISILLEAKPNEASTTKIIDAINPYLDAATKSAFLSVFEEKERRHQQKMGGHAAPLQYALMHALS